MATALTIGTLIENPSDTEYTFTCPGAFIIDYFGVTIVLVDILGGSPEREKRHTPDTLTGITGTGLIPAGASLRLDVEPIQGAENSYILVREL